MASAPIEEHRLSPSGPPIGGDPDNPVDVGEGQTLAQDQLNTNITNTNQLVLNTARPLSNDGVADLLVSFTTPSAGEFYMAESGVDVENTGTQSAVIELQIQSRVDGATWVTQAATQHTVPGNGTSDINRMSAYMDRTALSPAVPGTDSVEFRSQAVMINDGPDNGAIVTLDAPPTSGTTVGNSFLRAQRVL